MSRDGWEYWARFTLAMVVIFTIFILFSACTSTPTLYNRQPLKEQRLAPRPGFKGLTNQICSAKDPKTGLCAKVDVIDYDLTDIPTRTRLRDLRFICNVAGERYRIAASKAGLVQNYTKGLFAGLREKDFISIETGYQRLLDANTFCAAQDSDLGRVMFQR